MSESREEKRKAKKEKKEILDKPKLDMTIVPSEHFMINIIKMVLFLTCKKFRLNFNFFIGSVGQRYKNDL